MNPEGGEEKTIKGHACHELTTTALAVAPCTIHPSSTRNVCSQCFFFFFPPRFLCSGYRLYPYQGVQAVQGAVQRQERKSRSQRSQRGLPVSRGYLSGSQGSGDDRAVPGLFILGRLYSRRFCIRSPLPEAFILGALLCGTDETLHAEVGP